MYTDVQTDVKQDLMFEICASYLKCQQCNALMLVFLNVKGNSPHNNQLLILVLTLKLYFKEQLHFKSCMQEMHYCTDLSGVKGLLTSDRTHHHSSVWPTGMSFVPVTTPSCNIALQDCTLCSTEHVATTRWNCKHISLGVVTPQISAT